MLQFLPSAVELAANRAMAPPISPRTITITGDRLKAKSVENRPHRSDPGRGNTDTLEDDAKARTGIAAPAGFLRTPDCRADDEREEYQGQDIEQPPSDGIAIGTAIGTLKSYSGCVATAYLRPRTAAISWVPNRSIRCASRP